jgi:hypothetical protein
LIFYELLLIIKFDFKLSAKEQIRKFYIRFSFFLLVENKVDSDI